MIFSNYNITTSTATSLPLQPVTLQHQHNTTDSVLPWVIFALLLWLN